MTLSLVDQLYSKYRCSEEDKAALKIELENAKQEGGAPPNGISSTAFLAAARPSTQCVLACSMSRRAFAAVSVLQGEVDAGNTTWETLVVEHAEAVAVAAAGHSAALGELEEQMTARLTEAEVRPSCPPPDCTVRLYCLVGLPDWAAGLRGRS